ncbi:MAG: PilZ domain-containing protein, partial [Candidatus Omnitrophota bacterium]
MIEKRKFLRFDANMAMEYRRCEGKALEGVAEAKDLCREGMRCAIGKKFEKGELLDIKVHLNDNDGPVFLRGEVAWTKEPPHDDDHEYLTGLSFRQINRSDKMR